MSSIISLSNSKKDVQAVTDPSKRAFIPRLIKSFNPLLSAHLESLKNSSSKLASFDPSTTKKESYLLFSASRFHYFEQYESEFSFGRNIYEDCFKVLGKHLHFRFAEVASEKIVSKIEALNQSSSQPVQESSETFKVLGDTGVLLELNYKVVHVRLDLQAKRRNWSYVSGEEEQKAGNSQVGINFVAIFFGILAIYLPTPLQTEKEKVGGLDVEVSKKEIEYIALKRELMKFIGVKKSSSYYLVFHKFHLLHRLKYREYSDKYLTEAAVKEGFFGSIASFFKGAAGTIANGVSKAVQTASSVVDFYQQNIKPAVDILTPIVSPLLPDNLRSLVSNQGSSKENSDFKETQPIQEAKKLARETKSSVQQCLNYLNGKRILKSFQKHLKAEEDEDNGKEMGVDVQKIRKSVQAFMGTITVERPAENGFTRNMKYSGFLFNKSTILTPKISVQENDSVRFDLKGSTYFQIEVGPPGSYSYFNFTIQDQSLRKGIDELFQEHEGLRFKLDFKEEYSSDECFYEGLINRNLFLAELVGETRPVLHMQVSKAIRCYREVFYHLFQKSEKSQGGVIFYLDEQEKSCRIISIYDKSRSEEFAKILNHQDREGSATLFGNQEGSVVTQAMKNCSSEFLNYNTYAFLQESSEQSSKEATLFVETDEAGGDDNADGESLRTQLTTNKITKSSPLELIAIIAMENQSQKRFGVGLLSKDQNKKPLYCLTLKQNVLYEGIGFVYVRKPHNKEEGPVTFNCFDYNKSDDYEAFEIKYIIPYDDFEDYVFVMFNDSSESFMPTTQRQLNFFSKSITQNTSTHGGFYVEFDLSQVYETKVAPFRYRELLEPEQSSFKMNVTSKFPQNQGIFFAYNKQAQKKQSFLGFYSSNSTNKIIFPPQKKNSNNEAIIFRMQRGQSVQISRMKKPNRFFNSSYTYESFQAVGQFKFNPKDKYGDGSGAIIRCIVAGVQKDCILTAAHVLKGKTTTKAVFRYNYGGILFKTFSRKIQLEDSTIHQRTEYNNLVQNSTLTYQQRSRIQSELDMVVIDINRRTDIRKPLILDLNTDSHINNDIQLDNALITKTNLLMDVNNLPSVCVAGFPMRLNESRIRTKIVEGDLYYQIVKDQVQNNIPNYPQSIISVRPVYINNNNNNNNNGKKFLYYLLSTLSGQSGGPVFNLTTFDILGVHNGAYENGSQIKAASNRGAFIYSRLNYRYLKQYLNP